MKALEDKVANVLSPQSEQDILDELRDLTDEHFTVNQIAVEWLSRTERLAEMQGTTTTTRRLYDLFCKGPHLRHDSHHGRQ